MYRIKQMALAVALVVAFSSTLAARSLTLEEIKLLDGIKSDSEAKQQAETQLNPNTKAQNASAQSNSKPPAKKVASTPAAPPSSNSAGDTKKPDAITQLLQSNANRPWNQQQYSPCAGFVFLLRQDWKDVGNVAGQACPSPAASAQGAQISFANDRVADNRIATINGTAALLYNSVSGNPPSPLIPYAVSFGAYTTVDDVSNSATSKLKSNVDTLAFGGLVELGYTTSTGANYFTLRGGSVEDNIKDTTAGNAVLDWSPVIYPFYIHYPYHFFPSFGLPIIVRFDPDLVARFDSATGKNQILAFNNRQDSLRLGPELALSIWPDPGYISGPLSRFTGLLSYDSWYETYEQKELWWFTSSLTYNIDEAGNFGIKGSYNRGRDETTGNMTNIYTVGLSGKI